MTQFARVKGGQVQTIGLPRTGTLASGASVSNYHLLPVETLKAEGWLEVMDEKPTYDPETEDLVFDGHEYDYVAKVVRAKYSKQAKPPPPEPEPDPKIARQKFRDVVNAATTLAQLKAAILGDTVTENPGAAPDIPRK